MSTNLIGISGKIGSGKDTVAKIIQYLTSKRSAGYTYPSTEDSISSYIKSGHDLDSIWEIKKFAGKLKQIVAVLIGCSVEQLEDQDFKSALLGEDWRRWYWAYYKIASDSNPTGRATRFFATEGDAVKYKYSLDDTCSGFCAELKSEVLTPRMLLQLIGTECGRVIIHPEIWVNAMFAGYTQQDSTRIEMYESSTGDVPVSFGIKKSKWIITDVRFPNEAKAIKDRGGVLIRVNRGVNRGGHGSEIALDNYDGFDFVIDNAYDINYLVGQVEQVLKDLQ